MSCETCCCDAKRYDDVSKIIPPASLDELIKELRKIFASDNVNVEYVTALMESYKSNVEDWKKYSNFDPHKYTRNLVDEGNGKYNLLVLCWNLNQGSTIHAHANSHCFMKVLSGSILEERFDWPDDPKQEAPMKKKSENEHVKEQCAYIHDKIGLHRVSNPSHVEQAITLHLYSPPYSEAKCFDEQTGHVTTCKLTLWSKYGAKTESGEPM